MRTQVLKHVKNIRKSCRNASEASSRQRWRTTRHESVVANLRNGQALISSSVHTLGFQRSLIWCGAACRWLQYGLLSDDDQCLGQYCLAYISGHPLPCRTYLFSLVEMLLASSKGLTAPHVLEIVMAGLLPSSHCSKILSPSSHLVPPRSRWTLIARGFLRCHGSEVCCSLSDLSSSSYGGSTQ